MDNCVDDAANDTIYDNIPTANRKTPVRTRCTARTAKGLICRNKIEEDCRYCKTHGKMYRTTIPVYEIPKTAICLNELKPCPACTENITYGQLCNSCVNKMQITY